MKVAYLDCASGISGDMMLGALVDAGVRLASIQTLLDSLSLPSCRLTAQEVKKKGFRATQIVVEHEPEHAHRHLHDIVALIEESALSAEQQDLAKRIFTRLGEAEAKVHGTTIEKVHFHEVGAVDSIADIVGTAIGWTLLGIDRACASPIPTGGGFIEIAHGRCSVPAPATGELLKGIPLARSNVEAELTTPTGAAIIATLVSEFGPLPPMTVDAIGYGAGQRDLAGQANLLRLVVGQTNDTEETDRIWVVETNLDDISGELIGYCASQLWEAGALDVYTTAIQMKKNRPGVKLTALCGAADLQRVEAILFQETTTLGVRRWSVERSKLERRTHQVDTSWGMIDGVLACPGGGQAIFSPEFESCRRIAAQHNVPLRQVYEAARQAFDPGDVEPK